MPLHASSLWVCIRYTVPGTLIVAFYFRYHPVKRHASSNENACHELGAAATIKLRFLPHVFRKVSHRLHCSQVKGYAAGEVLGYRWVSLRLANPKGWDSIAKPKPSHHDSTICSHDIEKRVSLLGNDGGGGVVTEIFGLDFEFEPKGKGAQLR